MNFVFIGKCLFCALLIQIVNIFIFRWPTNLERIKLKNLFSLKSRMEPTKASTHHSPVLNWGGGILMSWSHSSEIKDERIRIKYWLAPQDKLWLPAGQHSALLWNSIREIKTIFHLLLKHTKAKRGEGGHNFPSIFSKTVVPDVFPTKGTLETKLAKIAPSK